MPATSVVAPPPLPPPPQPICHSVAPANPPAEVFRKSRRVNMIVSPVFLRRKYASGADDVAEAEHWLDVAAGCRRDRVHGRTSAAVHGHRLRRDLLGPCSLPEGIGRTPGC